MQMLHPAPQDVTEKCMVIPKSYQITTLHFPALLTDCDKHDSYFAFGGTGFAFVTAAMSCSTTLLPDFLPISSISLTLMSVSFFASSSAFWLPELCWASVSLQFGPARSCVCAPPVQTSDTRCPCPSCSPQSPSALRFVRPLLALCGLGGLGRCSSGVS